METAKAQMAAKAAADVIRRKQLAAGGDSGSTEPETKVPDSFLRVLFFLSRSFLSFAFFSFFRVLFFLTPSFLSLAFFYPAK